MPFLYVFLICVRARILKKKITNFWCTYIFPLQGYCLNHEHGLGSSRNVISSNVTSLVVKSCCIESECICKMLWIINCKKNRFDLIVQIVGAFVWHNDWVLTDVCNDRSATCVGRPSFGGGSGQ